MQGGSGKDANGELRPRARRAVRHDVDVAPPGRQKAAKSRLARRLLVSRQGNSGGTQMVENGRGDYDGQGKCAENDQDFHRKVKV